MEIWLRISAMEVEMIGVSQGRFTFVNDKWWSISGHDRNRDPDGNEFLSRYARCAILFRTCVSPSNVCKQCP